MSSPEPQPAPAPFHAGEIAIQRSIGAAERMDAVGRKVVRNFMPDQHRQFFAQLPFLLVGAVDRAGDVWATLLTGAPGFAVSPDPKSLTVSTMPAPEDPARPGMEDGDAVGLLGIEFHTRRRNRLNGIMTTRGADGFTVAVEQSFGNCPKYIQLRDIREENAPGAPSTALRLERLNDRARRIVSAADTFFVASYADRENGARQVDMSHRGGKPGFVRIDGAGRLTIPDFTGNRHFNTLGNILANGKAGLLFVDFDTGGLLQLTGEAEVVLDSPEIDAFGGSERLWTFTPRRIVFRPGAVALRWSVRDDGISPHSLATGSWELG